MTRETAAALVKLLEDEDTFDWLVDRYSEYVTPVSETGGLADVLDELRAVAS
jgi:hypothetical protein